MKKISCIILLIIFSLTLVHANEIIYLNESSNNFNEETNKLSYIFNILKEVSDFLFFGFFNQVLLGSPFSSTSSLSLLRYHDIMPRIDMPKDRLPDDITLSFVDYPLDIDGNGLYDFLIIEFEINLSKDKEYNISAWLVDDFGRSVSFKSRSFRLNEDKSTVQLNFSGIDIYANRMDGHFKMGGLIVEGDDMDIYLSKYIYNTSQYNYNEFEYQIPLFNCGSLNKKNIVYVLQNDINAKGDCFSIQKDNVNLDLNGHSIIGDGSGRGVYWRIYGNNVIENGSILNFSKGIEIKNSNNHIIKNCSISMNKGDGMNNGMGIYLFRSHGNKIIQNNFSSNSAFAIELDGSDNNLIVKNNIQNGLKGGINIFSSHNNSVENNIIKNNKYIAVYLNIASENLVKGNNIEKNELWGIYMSGGNEQENRNNVIEENFIFQNGRSGIRLTGSNNLFNEIISNVIKNNFDNGIELFGKNNNEVSNNLIEDNIISDNWLAGIVIFGAEDNTIKDNQIERHDCGIVFDNDLNDNDFVDNFLKDNEEDFASEC